MTILSTKVEDCFASLRLAIIQVKDCFASMRLAIIQVKNCFASMRLAMTIGILILTSCSSKPRWEIEREPQKYEVEVVTIDDLALEAVQETKTDFFVPMYDDMAAWDRTKIFFVKYLEIPDLKKVIQKSAKTTFVTNANENDSAYKYQVKKEIFGNGYNYFVECKASGNGASAKQAAINAKNLSRFISSGTLETTLLK